MDYTGLLVWQRAIDLCGEVYRITENFPRREIFGLSAQMRKSAVSVASNIAEGEGRLTLGERRQFLSQARGSLYELETQLITAQRIGLTDAAGVLARVAEERRSLDNYIAYVRRISRRPNRPTT